MTATRTQPSALSTQPSRMRGCIVASYRHYKGKKLGPYYFRKWKIGRRTFKQYIKPADLEKTRTAIDAARTRRKQLQAGAKKYGPLLDNFNFLGKMMNLFDQGKEPREDQKAYILRIHKEGPFITGRPLYRARRLFGDPSVSNFFMNCLYRTRDWALSRRLTMLEIHPDDVDADLSHTTDPAVKKTQMDAVLAAFSKRTFEASRQ
jgi:hypothetical protein